MKHGFSKTVLLRLFVLSMLLLGGGSSMLYAQFYMNIRKVDGSLLRYPVNTVDSVWFDEITSAPIPFTLTDGYIFYKDGKRYNSSAWQCTDFIQVEPNRLYYLNVSLPGNNAGYAFYDSGQNYIIGANTIIDNTIISPTGACYLRFSTPTGTTDEVLLYAINDNNGENEGFIIKNNNQDQMPLLPSGTYLLDNNGKEIDLSSNYGHDNQVLAIPVSYKAKRSMVIRFKVKFNDDLNKKYSGIDYTVENPNLLNFFGMTSGEHKIKLGVLPDNFKNPDAISDYEVYGQCIGLQGTTKIKALNADNTSNTDHSRITALTFDNYRFKTLTGGRLFSVRWLDNTADNEDVCMSNDGNVLKFYHYSDGSIIAEYAMGSYATLTDLYEALRSNVHLEVRLYQHQNKTPADIIEFKDIKLVSKRTVVDGAGTMLVDYPTKTIYDNAPLYVLDKIDDGWHTVEIAADRQIDSGVFCCCVDGTYLYAGTNPERISYYDGDSVTLYLGGDENGAKINCSIKDVEIKYDNNEDTEIVSYDSYSRPQIISNWHPKVYVIEGHSFSDTYPGGQSVDRMDLIFKTLTEKGYKSITLEELRKWVEDGVVTSKRMFYAIYDDHQYEIYLNPKLKDLHKRYNVYTGLAEITNQSWWDYDGERYQVPDINDKMIEEGWIPLTHTRHQVHNTFGYEDLVKAIELDIDDLEAYHIPQIGLVWPGGQSNIMCQEVVEDYGWPLAFDIYRSGYYASITDGVKKCDKTMMLPRFVICNRIPIAAIIQEIM